jgi:outer membrane protein assembly factor BamB
MNSDAGYSVPAGPVIAGRTAYYGAWDTYVYAVDAGVGCLEWFCQGWGSSVVEAAKRYYSPAGSPAAFAGGRVLVADRHYDLSAIDPEKGVIAATLPGVSAVSASADGVSAYLRKTNGHLVKVNAKLEPVWDSPVPTGWVPAPPLEYDGGVYCSSDDGTVSAVDSSTGKLLWRYQAAPRARVSAPLSAGGGMVYVAALDGTLTALEAR